MNDLEDRLFKTMQLLCTKTMKGQVIWRQFHSGDNWEKFSVDFGDGSVISIEKCTPSSDPDIIRLALYVNNREAIEITADDGREPFAKLDSMFQIVKRDVIGHERALDQIQKLLSSDEKIIGIIPDDGPGF